MSEEAVAAAETYCPLGQPGVVDEVVAIHVPEPESRNPLPELLHSVHSCAPVALQERQLGSGQLRQLTEVETVAATARYFPEVQVGGEDDDMQVPVLVRRKLLWHVKH